MTNAIFSAQPNRIEHAASREDAGRTLARYAAALSFDALPPPVVHLTKQCILDVIGTTLAATTLAPEAPRFHNYVRGVGGTPECTLVGYGEKAPPQMAAFLNGCNSHMLDYDDVGSGHVSVATVSSALAMAEKARPTSGRELLTAVALGIDIHTRIYPYESTEEWDLKQPLSATQSIGYISGAAVAARLAKLPAEKIADAMGLGYQQVSGASQRHLGMHAGWCSQGAVLAALLAVEGIPGVKDILDGKNGLFKAYFRIDKPDYERLTGDLGQSFRTLELHGFKAWPACGANRRPVTAILDLRREHSLKPEDVESIVVSGGEHLFRLSEPLEYKRRPPHSAQAKFSLPFTCGAAMAHGDVRLHNYTAAGLKDPSTLAMADRVWVRKDDSPKRGADTASVEIRMKDGRVLHKQVVHPLGDDRRNPMSQTQLEVKFRDCASYAVKPIAPNDIERIISLVGELERVENITEITRLL